MLSRSRSKSGGGPAVHQYHPGHYIGFEVTRNGVGTMPDKWSVAIQPGVVGVQMRYYWKDLEPTQGNYDFTQIAEDLADAAARGLQLIALIIDKTFNSQVATPPYLDAYTSPTANGTILLRWKPMRA